MNELQRPCVQNTQRFLVEILPPKLSFVQPDKPTSVTTMRDLSVAALPRRYQPTKTLQRGMGNQVPPSGDQTVVVGLAGEGVRHVRDQLQLILCGHFDIHLQRGLQVRVP